MGVIKNIWFSNFKLTWWKVSVGKFIFEIFTLTEIKYFHTVVFKIVVFENALCMTSSENVYEFQFMHIVFHSCYRPNKLVICWASYLKKKWIVSFVTFISETSTRLYSSKQLYNKKPTYDLFPEIRWYLRLTNGLLFISEILLLN